MQALTVARLELMRRIRSRSAIVTSVIAPLALAIVFGLMLDNTSSASFSIGLVDGARDEVSGHIIAEIVAGNDAEAGGDGETSQVVFVEFADRDVAAVAVDDDEVGAAIILDELATITVLSSPASPLSGQVAESIAAGIASSIDTGGRPPTRLEELPLGGSELSASAYFGASMAILLLFFATGLAAQSMLEDKENRTLDRMLSGPTTAWDVLIGKVIAVALLAIGGFATVWVVTTVGFGARWGNPLGVGILIVFTIIALAGVATFVGGFATTPQQATTLTAVVTFGLSLLGGNFTGPADAPAALRTLRRFTPNGRALEAFTELSVDGASARSLATAVVSLLAFGLVFGAAGLTRIHRSVTS